MPDAQPENIINHMALVVDNSVSMRPHQATTIKVADAFVAHLARQSKELDQETRLTIYSFGDKVTCLVYDMDVLRVPSIASRYKIQGNTALIDATLKMLDDLAQTPQIYGEHAFLGYVITDGQENASRTPNKIRALPERLKRLADNWTLAVFVPDADGVFWAKKFGFPANHVAVWDTTNARGLEEVGRTITRSADTFMANRRKGVKSSTNLFELKDVKATDIAATLVSLTPNSWALYDVLEDGRIDEFVRLKTHKPYAIGRGYYQLSKPETIQPQKQLAIMYKGDIYVGPQARTMLGLPDTDARVRPSDHKDYTVFVQSTSVNRKLKAGTKLLVLR
jgi:hypothetical protein